MSKFIIDVVNFNADASCLSSAYWLDILKNGNESPLCKWLSLYVAMGKKVVLGFPGATIADISTFNPEAIHIINGNPSIFQIIIRPFAHDLGLLRTVDAFRKNFEYGFRTIRKEFKNTYNYYLAPEFMLTDEQVHVLANYDIEGTFVNPDRYSRPVNNRIPKHSYKLRGIFNSELVCVPFLENGARYYLESLQLLNVTHWNALIKHCKNDYAFTWRDGESLFFLPDGLSREKYWLENETHEVIRAHLSKEGTSTSCFPNSTEQCITTYPVHSCLSWMREFRMMGFISRVLKLEEKIPHMERNLLYMWLMIINSDILSSIEKDSPIVKVKSLKSEKLVSLTIQRSERWHEGIEYLNLCESYGHTSIAAHYGPDIDSYPPYVSKFSYRLDYLKKIDALEDSFIANI